MTLLCHVYGSLPIVNAKTTALCKFALIFLPRNKKAKNNENDGISLSCFHVWYAAILIAYWLLMFTFYCFLCVGRSDLYNEGKQRDQGI